jgi:hypothetical protein
MSTRKILPIPGGKYDNANPWSRYTPKECCEKLTRLLRYQKGHDHTPFIIKSKFLDPVYREGILAPVARSWFHRAEVKESDLEAFYSLVLDEEDADITVLPYITTVGGQPVSWFVPTMNIDNMYVPFTAIRNVRESMVCSQVF